MFVNCLFLNLVVGCDLDNRGPGKIKLEELGGSAWLSTGAEHRAELGSDHGIRNHRK